MARVVRHNRRIAQVHGLLLLGTLLLAGRMVYLQAWKGPELSEKAQAQQTRTIPLAGKRGLILDRNGKPLAMNLPAFSLFAQPTEFNKPVGELAFALAPILGKSADQVAEMLQGTSFRFLDRRLDNAQADQVRKLRLAGIGLVRESKRVYPYGSLAASLLGFVGIDNQGLAGLEISFDKLLRADGETLTVFTDALGQEVLRQGDHLPLAVEKVEGNHVVLTLDETLQHIAERRLKASVDMLKAERGGVMVLDLENGDVLAMATYPTFDANKYGDAKWHVIKNWMLTDIYEPGSTFKLFTLGAALETNVVGAKEVVPCPGEIKVGGWRVQDHGISPSAMRYLQPVDILEVSSNTGTSIIGRRMDAEAHRRMLSRFGFGRTTGSRLTGESPGILPELPWGDVRQSTISFGQGISVTPLQIVTAATALGRQGNLIQPRFIQRVDSPLGDTLQTFPPRERPVIRPTVADQVLGMMEAVVSGKEGTGRAVRIPGYTFAGKTGTADKVVNGRYNGDVISSFVSFMPATNPRYQFFVVIDRPRTYRYASETAVPLTREIASDMIKAYRIPPENPQELLDKAATNGNAPHGT